MKIKYGFIILFLTIAFQVKAAEYSDGQLRLVINEATGRFSLYSLSSGMPQALFTDKDPRTSFLSVMVNDRSYKMGDTFAFRTSLENSGPSLIFESSFLRVTQNFSFVRTSSGSSGLRIDITIENRANRSASVGARYLIDTSLGEGVSGIPISTGRKTISSETLITRYDSESYWKDSNNSVSLSGSIYTGSPSDPDSVHIANWKKLADVTWKAPYQQGRNFNDPPYSVKDAAVCYYFEPRSLGTGERRNLSFTLAMNHDGALNVAQTAPAAASPPIPEVIPVHVAAFSAPAPGKTENKAPEVIVVEEAKVTVVVPEKTSPVSVSPVIISPVNVSPVSSLPGSSFEVVVQPDSREKDLAMLRALQERIDTHISAGSGTDGELRELELAINMLRAKYGINYR